MTKGFHRAIWIAAWGCLAACSRPLPPKGIGRFTLMGSNLEVLSPMRITANPKLSFNFDYPGPHSFLELEAQVWSKGQALPGSRHARESIQGPRNQLDMSLEIGPPEVAWPCYLKTELRFEEYGGSASTSTGLPLKIPDPATGWVATVAAAARVDLAEGQSVPIWAYLTHHEKLHLPPGTPLEEWAAKVDAALVVRARLIK